MTNPRTKIRGEINASKRNTGINTGGGLISGGVTYKVYQTSTFQRQHTRGNIHRTNKTYYK